MQKLWQSIPERLAAHHSRRKIIYMTIFALFGIIGNSMPGNGPLENGFGIGWILLSILSCFVLIRDFQRRLRSGHQLLQANKETMGRTRSFFYSRVYQMLLYILLPAAFVSWSLAWATMISYYHPKINHAIEVGQSIPNLGMAGALFLSLVASTEEIWRWSMLILILVICYKCFGRWWGRKSFQWLFMSVSLAISSMFFGLAHVLEFSTYQWTMFLLLSFSGLCMSLFAIMTRRFLLGMLVHFLYDFSAMSLFQNMGKAGMFAAAGAALLGVLLAVLFFYFVKRNRHHLNLSSYQAGRDDHRSLIGRDPLEKEEKLPRKAEFIMGLVGGILGIVYSCLAAIFSMILLSDPHQGSHHLPVGLVASLVVGAAAYCLITSVIGLIGATQVRNRNKEKRSGILMVITGALQIVSIHGILLLIAGLITLIRNPQDSAGNVPRETDGIAQGK